MKNVAKTSAAQLVLAGAARPSVTVAACAYAWHGTGTGTRPALAKHRSEMIADVFKTHQRWPGDPSS